VAAGAIDPAEPIVRAIKLVDAPRLLDRLLGAGEGEHVLGGRDHGIGARRGHLDEVGEVEASGQEARDRLLAVLRADGRKQVVEVGDVAGGGGRLDPLIQGREERRDRPAARAAERAQSLGVDVGPGGQIVQPADGVPDEVARDVVAHRRGLPGSQAVLSSRSAHLGGAQLGIVVLQPLALGDDVVGQHQDAGPRQVHRETAVADLAVQAVAQARR
jgi:hypothetical protein